MFKSEGHSIMLLIKRSGQWGKEKHSRQGKDTEVWKSVMYLNMLKLSLIEWVESKKNWELKLEWALYDLDILSGGF